MAIASNSGRAKDRGCNPVSSNCVVWQGPDLDCIGVCRGDTISEVTAKLATQLCMLIDLLDLESYDFSCLNPETNPESFNELIQILIDRVCAIEGIDPGNPENDSDCPDDCIVNVASCFYVPGPGGTTIIQMPLIEYVQEIGTRICSILTDIQLLQGGLQQVDEEQNLQSARINTLDEEKVGEDQLQYQVNAKTDSSAGIQFLPDAVRFIENSLISTQDALGKPSQLYSGILKGQIDSEDRLADPGSMSTISNWVNNAGIVADSINNLWLTIGDLRSAVEFIQENCCSQGCDDLFLNFTAARTVNISQVLLTIYTGGSTGFTSDWQECTTTTPIRVTDTKGNVATFSAPLINTIGNPSGYQVDLTGSPLDPTTDWEIVAESCFENNVLNVTCEREYKYDIIDSAICPSVTLTLGTTTLGYNFSTSAGYNYIANVYYAAGATPVSTQIINSPGPVVSNNFGGLLPNTNYEFELTLVDGNNAETPCPRVAFTTLEELCTPPSGVTAMLTI